jgi:transposase InsO family protein
VDVFVRYKAEMQNQTGEKIKVLRSYRGGEFLSKLFAGVCEEAGIKRQMTAPYTPQQNGVVERRNRSIMEMARSMLKSMKIPGKFWGKLLDMLCFCSTGCLRGLWGSRLHLRQ